MKRIVLALIVGAALGYSWGYGDGTGSRGTIVSRTLDRFGTSKLKAAQRANERRIDEASRP